MSGIEPGELQALSQQIEEALDEQVTRVFQEAATEASTSTNLKNQTTASLFAERLHRYFDTRRSDKKAIAHNSSSLLRCARLEEKMVRSLRVRSR
jgi:hypothetical protein